MKSDFAIWSYWHLKFSFIQPRNFVTSKIQLWFKISPPPSIGLSWFLEGIWHVYIQIFWWAQNTKPHKCTGAIEAEKSWFLGSKNDTSAAYIYRPSHFKNLVCGGKCLHWCHQWFNYENKSNFNRIETKIHENHWKSAHFDAEISITYNSTKNAWKCMKTIQILIIFDGEYNGHKIYI